MTMYAEYVFFDPDSLLLAFFPILGLGPFFEKVVKTRFWQKAVREISWGRPFF
jgi:hypothetical protein